MKCFEEIVYSMYLDNELEPVEQRNVASHLEQCEKCREQVRLMAAENTRLSQTFEPGDKGPDLVSAVLERLTVPQGRKSRRWIWATAASLFMASFLFYFLWFNKIPTAAGETQVLICNARIEGRDVQSHIYNAEDPDTKYIWFEKNESGVINPAVNSH
jgi:anti-sigma factor RsiW